MGGKPKKQQPAAQPPQQQPQQPIVTTPSADEQLIAPQHQHGHSHQHDNHHHEHEHESNQNVVESNEDDNHSHHNSNNSSFHSTASLVSLHPQHHGHNHGTKPPSPTKPTTSPTKQHNHAHGDDHHGHSHSHGHSHEHKQPKKDNNHGHSHTNNHNHSHAPQQQFYSSYQSESAQHEQQQHNHQHNHQSLQIKTDSNSNLHSHIVCSHTQLAPECGHNECQPLEDPKRAASLRVLKTVTLLCFSFMCVEIIGGYFSGSLAIMTDAAHLLSDLISFLISLLSLSMASKSPNGLMTFGYHRVEILGALISVFLIWGLTIVLVYESIHRLLNPDLIEVHAGLMLLVAFIGFGVNIVMGLVLLLSGEGHAHSHGGLPSSHGHSHGGDSHGHDDEDEDDDHGHSHGDIEHGHAETDGLLAHDHDSHDHGHSHGKKNKNHGHGHNDSEQPGLLSRLIEWILPTDNKRSINIHAAILHVLGDLMQSVGVIFAALVIWIKPSWKLADPLCTLLFSVIVLTTTTRVVKQGVIVLMEGTPDGIDSHEVAATIQAIPSVVAVHDLHIWSLSVDQPALAVHLVVEFNNSPADLDELAFTPEDVLEQVNKVLKKKYGISHTTIQFEEINKSGVCVPKSAQCKRPELAYQQ